MGAVLLVQSNRQGGAVARMQLWVEAGELSTQGRVLKEQRRQQGGRDTQIKVGAQILDLPFQFHPSVLEPRFHLRHNAFVHRSESYTSATCDDFPEVSKVVPQTHLSFGQFQLLSHLSPLCSTQIFVLAEGVLQLGDLFRGELGPHPALLDGLPLAVLSHVTVWSRRVTAAVWTRTTRTFNSLNPTKP